MRDLRRKQRLLAGSELLRVGNWQQAGEVELKRLIKRFATREDQAQKKAKPSFLWRKRRLGAVSIYELRFGSVPDIFRGYKLPSQRSYYVHEGKYVWPETGPAGKPLGA